MNVSRSVSMAASSQFKDKLYKRYEEPGEMEERVNSADEDKHMPTTDLEEIVQQLRGDTELLEEENKTLASFWRVVSTSQQSLRVGGGPDGSTPSSNTDEDGVSELSEGSGGTGSMATTTTSLGGSKLKPKGRGRRRSSAQKEVMMQVDWKLEVASAEFDRLKHEKDDEIKQMEKNHETVRACIEEAELRQQETRRDMYEFKRDIVGDKKIVAEKILKYLEERLKLKETHVAKLKMKSSALKAQIGKFEHQLKQREDMGEVLHAIDFDQLKIENQQFLERIEAKNKELVKLKLTTGNTVQSLNTLTEKLNKFTQEQQFLKKQIKEREEHLEKLKEDIKTVQQEKEVAQKKNTQLRLQHEAVKVPKVEDYIQQKAEQFELEKASANWKRKVEIAEGQKKIVLQQRRQNAKEATMDSHARIPYT
eukprot:TRINITY_DN38387_c0_g1_i1.p1 TRINITY_DN38387_c0_g1~~TRINITY_DN38387_c0_g1_i1.p1  ORF type:complete len:437 (-),score=84.44 TRINITY_DN38387_c0_g1_i1:622-1887(-)